MLAETESSSPCALLGLYGVAAEEEIRVDSGELLRKTRFAGRLSGAVGCTRKVRE